MSFKLRQIRKPNSENEKKSLHNSANISKQIFKLYFFIYHDLFSSNFIIFIICTLHSVPLYVHCTEVIYVSDTLIKQCKVNKPLLTFKYKWMSHLYVYIYNIVFSTFFSLNIHFRCLNIYFFQDKMFHGSYPIISWNKTDTGHFLQWFHGFLQNMIKIVLHLKW